MQLNIKKVIKKFFYTCHFHRVISHIFIPIMFILSYSLFFFNCICYLSSISHIAWLLTTFLLIYSTSFYLLFLLISITHSSLIDVCFIFYSSPYLPISFSILSRFLLIQLLHIFIFSLIPHTTLVNLSLTARQSDIPLFS